MNTEAIAVGISDGVMTLTLNRPTASADKLSATVVPGAWDGVYR